MSRIFVQFYSYIPNKFKILNILFKHSSTHLFSPQRVKSVGAIFRLPRHPLSPPPTPGTFAPPLHPTPTLLLLTCPQYLSPHTDAICSLAIPLPPTPTTIPPLSPIPPIFFPQAKEECRYPSNNNMGGEASSLVLIHFVLRIKRIIIMIQIMIITAIVMISTIIIKMMT